MKKLIDIIEGLKIGSNSKVKYIKHTCKPKNKTELRNIIRERLEKNKNANLNDIDVSGITNMDRMFMDLNPHNINITEWDVSNVTNMESMFFGCDNFNSNLSYWDVSKVTNMSEMFFNCLNFNCNLDNWDVSNVKNMSWIFEGCTSLKKLPKWYKK